MKTISSICVKNQLCQAEIDYKYLGFNIESRQILQMPPNGSTINIIDAHTHKIQQTVIANHSTQEGRINGVDFLYQHDIDPYSNLLVEYIPDYPIYTLRLTLL